MKRTIGMAFNSWLGMHMRIRRRRQIIERAAAKWINRLMGAAWYSWLALHKALRRSPHVDLCSYGLYIVMAFIVEAYIFMGLCSYGAVQGAGADPACLVDACLCAARLCACPYTRLSAGSARLSSAQRPSGSTGSSERHGTAGWRCIRRFAGLYMCVSVHICGHRPVPHTCLCAHLHPRLLRMSTVQKAPDRRACGGQVDQPDHGRSVVQLARDAPLDPAQEEHHHPRCRQVDQPQARCCVVHLARAARRGMDMGVDVCMGACVGGRAQGCVQTCFARRRSATS